jgi:cell volume regulation protein A
MVFFIVLLSTLVQGSSIPLMARLLGLSVPDAPPGTDPLDLVATGNRELLDLRVPEGTGVVGQRVLDLGLPQGTLVMLIERDGDSFVPSGGTKIRAGDRLVVLTARAALPGIRARLEGAAP